MGQKIIRFSDLTGKHVEDDGELVRIVVRQHPDLEDGPVEIEALAEELTTLEELALDLVTIELHHPDSDEPETVVLEAETFNRLAGAAPMAEVLRGAKRVARTVPSQGAAPTAARERVNYASLDHAGRPHKGRTTDAEKLLVRQHLDAVNERLAVEGIRTIDLTNAEHVARYGLEELARERGVTLD
ncbi:hypothetical protein GCM10010441_63110 [Kitasatospora paracochleata]|uniref:Lsr2 protein n=1 Tax=Kitasatospora paracochleata TaxID=58354 RepID=A0ABT1J344_9ACTN|nr:hypothetical protein [Kitasatospora paracochleata]MCP2311856.1 hypothetical protein [Kitasatospora paracochleata]